MIIAAYAGTGKTAFAERYKGAIDVPSMPYRWILPVLSEGEREKSKELEREKGAYYHLENPLFPENYLAAILQAEKNYEDIIIPTIMSVIEILVRDYGRKVVLCYPDRSLREEYRQRYIQRGNSASFLEIFVDGWHGLLAPVEEFPEATHLVLKSGEYLTDLKEQLDKLSEIPAESVKPVLMEKLAKTVEEMKKNLVLPFWGEKDMYLYAISDIDTPQERQSLYEVGKYLFEACGIKPRITCKGMIMNYLAKRSQIVPIWVPTCEQFGRLVEADYKLNRVQMRLAVDTAILCALENPTVIMDIVTKSDNRAELRRSLCDKLGVKESEAQAIIDMRIGVFTKEEKQKIQEEKIRLEEKLVNYTMFLKNSIFLDVE